MTGPTGGSGPSTAPADPGAGGGDSPLLEAVRAREAEFEQAAGAQDVAAAVQAALDLEAELQSWAADTLDSDHAERGRALLRSMVVKLGELAQGARNTREVIGPFVEALLSVRATARAEKRYGHADAVRDLLVALGVEVRDSPDATEWDLMAGGPGQDGRLLSS